MKRLFSLLAVVLVLGLTFSVPDAEARRFGGGMSSGMKRDSGVMRREAAPTSPGQQSFSQAQRPAQPATPPAPAPSGMSRWLGPLAGLAAGIGLAALFSHLGLGEGMASLMMMLLIGAAIFFVVRMLMRRNAPQPQTATQYAGAGHAPLGMPPRIEPGFSAPAAGATAAPATAANIPAGFDVDGFLRQAKLNYIRLQAANDAGNMDDIRAVTTPEMFETVRQQFQERGGTKQHTDVMQLNAALLDVTSEAGRQVASVHFSGTIRESADGAAEAFDEVWHLTRPTDSSSGWIVAGIQQFN